MRKGLTGLLVVSICLAVVACGGTGGDAKVRVKCPACGYEFDAPFE